MKYEEFLEKRDILCAGVMGAEQVSRKNIQGIAGWWPRFVNGEPRAGCYSRLPPDYSEAENWARLRQRAIDKDGDAYAGELMDDLHQCCDQGYATSDRAILASPDQMCFAAYKTLEARA